MSPFFSLFTQEIFVHINFLHTLAGCVPWELLDSEAVGMQLYVITQWDDLHHHNNFVLFIYLLTLSGNVTCVICLLLLLLLYYPNYYGDTVSITLVGCIKYQVHFLAEFFSMVFKKTTMGLLLSLSLCVCVCVFKILHIAHFSCTIDRMF